MSKQEIEDNEVINKNEEIEEDDDERDFVYHQESYLKPSSINPSSSYIIREHASQCEFGELLCFYPNSNGDYRIVIASYWILYPIITVIYLLINVYFYYSYAKYLSSFIMKIGIGLYVTSFITSIKVFFSNPGIPNTKTNHLITLLPDDDRDFCEKCCVWNDNRKLVLHCRSCNCCIEDFDQHSIFFGKCIGKGNYISYNIFIVTNLLSLAFIILIKGLTH